MRNEIICHKPSGMPTASDDRFVNRHEYIFHFTPENGYYFDKFGFKTVYDDPIDVWKVPHDRNETPLAPFPEELVQRGLVAAPPPAVCQSCGHPRNRMVEKSLKQLNEDRPQAQRAMEIFEDSELEEKHLEAIQATGISDAGKGRKVQNGTGSELPRPTGVVRESEALSSSRDGEAVSNDFAPWSLRSGVSASASERPGAVPPAVPDSRGIVPGWVVRSVPLLPVRHSGTTAVARFLSSFERAKLSRGDETASPFRPTFEQRRTRGERRTTSFDRRGSTAVPYSGSESDGGRCIPSLLAPSALAAEGGLAPCIAQAKTGNP